MTGRVLYILREHGEWSSVEDLHRLYQTLLNMGFKPDDMSDNDLRQTAHNLKKVNNNYVWELFYTEMGHPFE